MEEINIKEFLSFIKEKMYYILIIILLIVSLVLVYDMVIKVPKYTTYTTIYIHIYNNN